MVSATERIPVVLAVSRQCEAPRGRTLGVKKVDVINAGCRADFQHLPLTPPLSNTF